MTAFGGALTDPTKVMGSRIGAYIVDAILGVVLLFVLGAAFGVSSYHSFETASSFEADRICTQIKASSEFGVPRTSENPTGNIEQPTCFTVGSTIWYASTSDAAATNLRVSGLALTISALNYVVLTAITGGSVGKLLFGLRVAVPSGAKAGVGRNILRWILLVVDTACCFIPGLVSSLNSKGHRRIGDMAAGTYVVHRSAMGRVLNIPGHIVVRRHDAYGGWGPAPAEPELSLAEGGGIDKPVFDPSRNTYVRYDQASGVWFQWDETTQTWVPAQQ